MEILERIYGKLPDFVPALIAIAVVTILLWAANQLLLRRNLLLAKGARFSRQIAMVVLTGAGVIIIVLALPVSDTTRGQLLGVLGLLLTAVIALSSTTFVANAMAGLMLRAVRNFRTGDFIRIEEQFGRVTERGLFHTEIQDEDGDLVTLPNLYLITNPIKVVRSSGTIVSATVSLGYDTAHDRIEELLVQAVGAAELQEPFVQILELGDFSVTYRAAGFLPEPKQILTARSKLRAGMLDTLHAAGVEIVSPTFMNQRRVAVGERAIPEGKAPRSKKVEKDEDQVPEERIFDKAEEAERIEGLRDEQKKLLEQIEELKTKQKEASDDERAGMDRELERLTAEAEKMKGRIEDLERKEP